MTETNRRVVIVEGMQGSGKTTAIGHLSQIGCKPFRGIPSGQELADNREVENWRQSMGILELAFSSADGSIAVMDRSIWSLVAYNIRMKPDHRTLIYKLGKQMFEKRLKEKSGCTIVFLEVDPNVSFAREDGQGIHSHRTIAEATKEAQVYRWLMESMERDGFNVIRIPNNDITLDEFRGLIEDVVRTTD